MNFDMPKAVFCGLALIAAAIFFGPGSALATAQSKVVVTTTGQWSEQTCRDINKIAELRTSNTFQYFRMLDRSPENDKEIFRNQSRTNLSLAAKWASMWSAFCNG